jgi:hypothetical protein
LRLRMIGSSVFDGYSLCRQERFKFFRNELSSIVSENLLGLFLTDRQNGVSKKVDYVFCGFCKEIG